MKQTLSLVYAGLGALLAAPAVISLIEHWAATPLPGGFQSFVDAYRGALGPVFGWFDAGVGALLGASGIRVSFPGWLEDLHVLSLVTALIYLGSRMLDAQSGNDPTGAHAGHPAYGPEDLLEQQQLAREKARQSDAPSPPFRRARGIVAPLAIVAAGLLGLGVVWLPEILIAMIGHRASWRDESKAHFAWATAALVVAFYAAAWAMGFGAK